MGSLAIGTFDPNTGNLTEGKITYPGDRVVEGKFDPAPGIFLSGNKLTEPNGKVFIYNGTEWIPQEQAKETEQTTQQ